MLLYVACMYFVCPWAYFIFSCFVFKVTVLFMLRNSLYNFDIIINLVSIALKNLRFNYSLTAPKRKACNVRICLYIL